AFATRAVWVGTEPIGSGYMHIELLLRLEGHLSYTTAQRIYWIGQQYPNPFDTLAITLLQK
ncbi:MAG: hypothetical protein AAF810_16750, partial [Cyanobacteria bacterium P01_D01_bin.36]